MNPREEKKEAAGVLTKDDITNVIPPKERLQKGSVAIIECVERIPCDPCKEACPLGAISKKSLIEPPRIDWNRCNGCGACLSVCPGLAIFLIDLSLPGGKGLVTMPYELLPVPKVEEEVYALDRRGKPLSKGQIVKTRMSKDKTTVVTVAVDEKIALDVRNIGRTAK